MKFKKFLAFLPNGTGHQALLSVLKFLVGFEFDFDLQFVLQARQVPSTVLTTRALRQTDARMDNLVENETFCN